MVAPAFASTGGIMAGSGSTTAAMPVPTGVVGITTDPTEVIIAAMYVEPNQAVTPDTGFVHAGNSPVTNASATKPLVLSVFYKRATAADTGTYAFTVAAGLDWREGWCMRYTGCVQSGNPFDFTKSATADSGAAGSFSALSDTTLGADRLLLHIATTYDGRTATASSGFTNRSSSGAWLVADKAQAVAGPTGSITGSWAGGNTSTVVWLGALKPTAVAADTTKFFALLG